MFDFGGFGKRIQALRKARGMTQEELAERLGITAQAVSKWENGDSFPDITFLPTLAVILETQLNAIFGIAEAEAGEGPEFPKEYEGLPFAHSFGEIGCYSDKAVAERDGSSVKFADGSAAELSSRLVSNAGAGEIVTMRIDKRKSRSRVDYDKTEAEYEFGETDSLSISVMSNDARVVRSRDSSTRVYAKGSPEFISLLDVSASGKTLAVRFKDADDVHIDRHSDNEVRVEVPYDKGVRLDASINGQGELECRVPYWSGELRINGSGAIGAGRFDKASAQINGSGCVEYESSEETVASINGSGTVEAKSFGDLRLTINGSGSLSGERARSVWVGVNGSGDAEIASAEGSELSIKIAGSGSVEIERGEFDKLEANITGSCDLNLEGVTANTARITLEHDGRVVVGRVINGSVEQIKRKGTIKILNRGKAGE